MGGKKTMKKKVLSALLCVSMAATMLVGCGSKAADAPAADAPAAEEKAEEPAADDAAAEEPAAEDAAAYTGGITTDKT